jgi:hypothetical protein
MSANELITVDRHILGATTVFRGTRSTNKLRRIEAAADMIREAIAAIEPGEFRHLDIP